MKNRKTMIIVPIIFCVGMIIWLGLSAKFKNAFWCVTFSEWIKIIISLFVGYFVAYVFVGKNTKKDRFNDVVLKKIGALQEKLHSDENILMSSFNWIDWKVKLLASTKQLNNMIDLLDKYSECLNIKSEMEFIRLQFTEYRVLVTECIDELKSDTTKKEKAILKINLMLSKLDEIELKLFQVS